MMDDFWLGWFCGFASSVLALAVVCIAYLAQCVRRWRII